MDKSLVFPWSCCSQSAEFCWVIQNGFRPLCHVLMGRDGEGARIQSHTKIFIDSIVAKENLQGQVIF